MGWRTPLFALSLIGGPAAFAGAAPTPAETACRQLDQRLSSVEAQDCASADLKVSDSHSGRGQPLLLRDFPPTSAKGAAQKVLLIGGMHGDELSSVSIVFHWMRRLAREPFQPFHWRVLPCLNPDGLLSSPSTRVNARGVDLNRNFPTPLWRENALPYWTKVTRRDPRRYPGREPLSEPETRWLAAEIERFKPDAIVTVHAPYGVLDYDGPHDPPEQIGFLHLHLLGAYPGSLGNYAGLNLDVPVITLELPSAGTMPTAAQVARIWNDLLTWLDGNLPQDRTKNLNLAEQP